MLRQFIAAGVMALARAIIAYACADALHLEHAAPDAPLVVYIAATLVTFLVRIKLVVTIRRRSTAPDDRG